MALVVGGTTVTGTQTVLASVLTGTASAINGSNITNLDAADLSGTLPAINGSNLTNLPSSAPTSSQVGSAMAGLAVNSIGTYCALWREPRANHNPGTSVSGSYLVYTTFNCYPRTGNVSGTWRTMGRCSNHESHDRSGTLFMRIS